DLHALVRANVDNEAEELMWGAPGTLLAAEAMWRLTGEKRWEAARDETAGALRARRAADGDWTQRLDGQETRGLTPPHGPGAHGASPCTPSTRCAACESNTDAGATRCGPAISASHSSSRTASPAPASTRSSTSSPNAPRGRTVSPARRAHRSAAARRATIRA